MPTYEYLCVDCANRREVFQSFSDEPLQVCEVCGGKLRKVIYPVGIQFKGSGFYSTDRRASHALSRGRNEQKADGKAESSSDGKSETKSDTKSDSKSGSKSESKSDGSGSSEPASTTKKAAEKSA
jgi:putative FmdB family regulatory protein